MIVGHVNPSQTLEENGIFGTSKVFYNLKDHDLITEAIKRDEGVLGNGGAFLVSTGKYTGRSPKDKFVVNENSVQSTIWWENNTPMEISAFNKLKSDMLGHMAQKEYFVQDLYAGSDPEHKLNVRMITELAWHSLFIRTMLRRPKLDELNIFEPEFTVINCPSFNSDPSKHGCRSDVVIAISFEQKTILIAGTEYAGENKKSIFSILNYLLPEKNIMPMHCSVNTGPDGDSSIFFGLSGTGKTTLSADPNRSLLGDDEHGWSDDGLFNFEGGCYAKLIRLSEEAEPEIYATTQMKQTVIENAILNSDGTLDLDDNSITENTRGAYPLEFIPNVTLSGKTNHPTNIIMLTADAFGVLPPISKLSPSQAMYHFLSGYTAKVAGTEMGLGKEPQATFSTCFGSPFMPRNPIEYGDLLKNKISEHNVNCWLVNTGWIGGVYGVGKRISIKDTRTLLNAALSGELADAEMRKDENFGFLVPLNVNNVDSKILDPKNSWEDPSSYDTQAKKLVSMFIDNFTQFENDVDENVKSSGPISI